MTNVIVVFRRGGPRIAEILAVHADESQAVEHFVDDAPRPSHLSPERFRAVVTRALADEGTLDVDGFVIERCEVTETESPAPSLLGDELAAHSKPADD